MFEQTDTSAHMLRSFIGGLVVIIGLILLTLLITAAASITTEQTSQAQASTHTKNARQVYTYDDPNAITAGLGGMAFEVGQAAGAVGQVADAAAQSTVSTLAQTGQFVGRSLYTGATFVTRGIVSSTVFVLRIPGNIFGLVSSASPVSAMIRPADNSQIPVIDPNATGQLAGAALPTAQSVVQASPSADPVAVWPIHGTITTLFGVPHWPYQPVHSGIDISDGRSSGVTPIKPFKPGRVVDIVHSYSGLGNHVVIDHGGGITSVYAHLSSIAVQEGQNVDKTTVLGYEGSTGASTGTHLHFEIRVNGQPVDPRKYIAGQP
jgi:murein DD-endopeptidase MepM/ murein hydrolase activator NlpD